MKTGLTIQQLEELKKQGRIRDFRPIQLVSSPNGKIVSKHFQSKNPAKEWISWNLLNYCQVHCLKLIQEFRFSRQRKFRADWAIPEKMILIEYDGGLFMNRSGHNSAKGIQRDIEKRDLAKAEGYEFIRLTAMDYKELFNKLKIYIK